MRLVVIGAGIAGLAAAYEARRIADHAGIELSITILESEPRAGGKLWTEHESGVALEWGPDSFLASKPAASALASKLGLELIEPSPNSRRAYLLIGGELRAFPEGTVMGVPRGPSAISKSVRAGVVSTAAALRASVEPFIPGHAGDGPVADVVGRRLGRTWAERLVEPLIGGVYGAPAADLGMAATLPQFAARRSLILAARKQPRPTEPVFRSVSGGMERLAGGLVKVLQDEDLRLRTPALGIDVRDDGFPVRVSDGIFDADAVLLAVPAPIAANLLQQVATRAARALTAIVFSSSAIALLRYPRTAPGVSLSGSGYLVPRNEGLAHAACSWVTSKWPNRSDDVWLRAIVTAREWLPREDGDLATIVAREVGSVLRMRSEPTEVRTTRWEHALPIYGPGHLRTVQEIERSLPRGIEVAGASYRGVGVPDCIVSGRAAAARLLST